MENVILLIIDGFRNDFLKEDITPNLYNLTKKGIYFERAYSLGPWSPPSIKGLFTSTYPLMYDETISISPKTITIAEVLKAHGYKTAGFTLGGWISPFFNFDKGFDEFIWTIEEKKQINRRFLVKLKKKINDFFPSFRKLHRLFYLILNTNKKRLKRDEILIKRIINWIQQNKQSRFFIYAHLEGPHEPYLEGASKLKLIKANYNLLKTKENLKNKDIETIRELYKYALKTTDKQVKRFVEKLQNLGILDNTYLIICSDHGQQLYERGVFGHTPDFYEESIHVPLMILGNKIKAKKIREPVTFLDLAPTILDFLNIKQPPEFLGKNLLKHKRKYFFSEDARKDIVFPNINNLKYDLSRQSIAIIYENYKYIYRKRGKHKLFNLKKDSEEKNNLINKEKGIAKKLKNQILEHLKLEERTRSKSQTRPKDYF